MPPAWRRCSPSRAIYGYLRCAIQRSSRHSTPRNSASKGPRRSWRRRPEARTAVMNVNLDMVSRNDRNEIFAAGTHHYPQFTPMLEDVRTRARVQVLFGHDRPLYRSGGVEDWTWLSDHYVFHGAGVPFVLFGVEDHPDYHSPMDTANKIDRRFFGDVVDMIIDAIPHVRRGASLREDARARVRPARVRAARRRLPARTARCRCIAGTGRLSRRADPRRAPPAHRSSCLSPSRSPGSAPRPAPCRPRRRCGGRRCRSRRYPWAMRASTPASTACGPINAPPGQ